MMYPYNYQIRHYRSGVFLGVRGPVRGTVYCWYNLGRENPHFSEGSTYQYDPQGEGESDPKYTGGKLRAPKTMIGWRCVCVKNGYFIHGSYWDFS